MRVEHGFLLGRLRKQGLLEIGQQRAEHRRPEQDAGEQHAP